MSLKSLKIQNYRTYDKAELEIGDINVLIGGNTEGKTNLLEAVAYLTFGKSFRSQDKDLVKWGEEYFRIEAKRNDNKKIEIFYSPEPPKKVLKIASKPKKQSELFGFNLAVVFTPEDINLIASSPDKKRRYLDMVISQVDKKYLYHLIGYKKILKQRNSLLLRIREGSGSLRELEVWSDQLVQKGIYIIKKRFDFFTDFESLLFNSYQFFSDDKLWLKYIYSVDNSEGFFKRRLKEFESIDIISARTTIGPHRDDFSFYLNDKSMESIGSRGEFRSAVLALKLAEIKYLENKTDNKPIFLLDDVFSELDIKRREALYTLITNYQTVITSTDLEHLSPELLEKAKIFKIENHEIKKA
ncbi:hypothetical protein AUK11_00975 [bacterium CG2_30_37_16]|nr:MAG: hypothetical protein AUK11_00975 [bacterium CG2_30_37_16]